MIVCCKQIILLEEEEFVAQWLIVSFLYTHGDLQFNVHACLLPWQ